MAKCNGMVNFALDDLNFEFWRDLLCSNLNLISSSTSKWCSLMKSDSWWKLKIKWFKYSVKLGKEEYACNELLAKQSFLKLIRPVVCLSGLLENIFELCCLYKGKDGSKT